MKKLLILLAVGSVLLPSINHGAQTAQARLFCLSVRLPRGTATDTIGFRCTMDVTTLNAGINAELAPAFFMGGYSNGAYVELYSELVDDTFSGAMALDTPDLVDANGNGFDDFFEVSQAVPALPGLGAYNISGFGNGGFTASWYREAGSVVGSCTYSIPNPFGGTLAFYHQFELLELKGPLVYTSSSNAVSATVSLTDTNSGSTLEGPIQFTKSASSPFNRLTLQSAFLTNASQQTFDLYMTTTFLRRTTLLTNYYGDVEFNDGDPNTTDPDYYTWMLSIDDLNDSDGDGIPDFSDNPQSVALPRRPLLSLAHGSTNLLLSISGDVGHLHRIQDAGSITAANWQTVLSVTLTNDPQVVALPLPSDALKFWRVQAE